MQAVQRIGGKRPTYGTRRMAAQVCRGTHTATNRKKIQRIFRKLGWIEPQKTKNDIIRTNRKLFKPDAPNQLWETDTTYVWCGIDGWCYCFNVVDCFTRRWVSYTFDVDATKQVAIDSITNAVSVENPDCSGLRLRTDNGTKYTGNGFRKAVSAFGIKHEFIWKHTPEQNGMWNRSTRLSKRNTCGGMNLPVTRRPKRSWQMLSQITTRKEFILP